MIPARRGSENRMTAIRASRRDARRRTRARKAATRTPARRTVKPAAKQMPLVPVQVLFRMCKSGWAVIVEKAPNAQGTRFVCPFCPLSHRVPGPVRGFRKLRRAPWVKLRRVEE